MKIAFHGAERKKSRSYDLLMKSAIKQAIDRAKINELFELKTGHCPSYFATLLSKALP
jgi:hypothetical protein